MPSQNESSRRPPLGELITKVDRVVGGNHRRISEINRAGFEYVHLISFPIVLFLTSHISVPKSSLLYCPPLATRTLRRDLVIDIS